MEKNYRSEITGVFGDPIEGNPTGVMEEAAYAQCGLNFRYITFKVAKDDLAAAMRAVRAFHMRGVNLTMPHKIAVLPYLDELSEAAMVIGAVNTVVVRDDGKLLGENTDGKGFVQALKNAGASPSGKNVVILGAGGAARAIAVECALAGAGKISIFNRTVSKAEELAKTITENSKSESAGYAWEPGLAIPRRTEILINATCVGLKPHQDERPDINYETITANMIVSDVVFNPSRTRFLEEAEKHGARTVNGLGMLACQGALNFTLWTGVDAPLQVMEDVLRREFGES